MKRRLLSILLSALCCCTAMAEYSDHRNRKQDSLETVLQSNPPQGENLIKLYDNLMWGYLQTDAEKSKRYAQNLIDEATKQDAPLSVQDGYRVLGLQYYGACIYDSAQYYFDLALEWTQKMKGHKRNYSDADIDNALSALYGTLANMHNMQGRIHIANEYYLKALKLFELHGWNESAAICYYNLGETYLEMSNNPQAEHYYRKSIEFADMTGDSLIIVMPRTGLAITLLNEKKPDEALSHALEALAYYQNHADEEGEVLLDTYVLLSRIYQLGYGNLDKAQDYMDEAHRLMPLLYVPSNNSDALSQQASICNDRKEWRKTVMWADSALVVNAQDPHHNIDLYKFLANAYAGLGKAAEAQKYIELLVSGMGELSTEQFQSSLSEMEVIYETGKKEARISQMEQEARMHQLQIVVLLVIIVALIIVSLVVWLIIMQRRRLAMIEAKMQGEADERTRLGRDLHDRLGSLLTAIRLSAEAETSASNKISTLAAEAQTEMRRVAHHLMPESLHHDGLRTALHDFVETLPIVTFHFTGTDRRLTEQQETMLYCTAHELVNNALRHAHARHIGLQLLLTDEYAALIVSDDGTGIDPQHQNHSGMGLANIRTRTEAFNGRLDISSNEHGTEINVEIPLK